MLSRNSSFSLHSKIRLIALFSFVLLSLGLVIGAGESSTAQSFASLTVSPFAQARRSSDGIWQEIEESAIANRAGRVTIPVSYRTVRLNKAALQDLLSRIPQEFSIGGGETKVVLTLPMPDGTFARFHVEESSIMEPGLQAKVPEIRTYRGQGIDDPSATMRFDWTPNGFHAIVLSTKGTVYIDPYAKGDTTNYISFYKQDGPLEDERFECFVRGVDAEAVGPLNSGVVTPQVTNGSTLRTYRLAVAATGEYTTFFRLGGDTDDQAKARALTAITTTMNRVNGIFEREIAVHMNLVANELDIIFTDPATDGYSNLDNALLLTENQTKLDAVIGTANYDMGHVFGTGGGGLAQLESPCDGARKAQGQSGLTSPVGDDFDAGLVAHEMGHQFGAHHTFNSEVAGTACDSFNRVATDAYEPASGSTIMSYAGVCGTENLQRDSNDHFHVKSLERMTAFISGSGEFNTTVCSANTVTGNTVPTISTGASFNIPKNTPFTLTATASDVDGDALTYTWEEFDLGPAAPPHSDTDLLARPLFRTYSPTSSPTRTFPSLTYVLNNANAPPATYTGTSPTGAICYPIGTPLEICVTGEVLPSMSRTMTFQVTARDNRAGAGAINSATMTAIVNSAAGPFVVTAPNTAVSITGGTVQTVLWDVAGTTAAPISAATVNILLSTDGGTTFPTVLAAGTTNDGTEAVTVPNLPTTTARIKAEAVGNIFFDISDTNFSITAPTAAPASISGRVTTSEGAPVGGVTMNLSGGRSAKVITDSDGNYRFNNIDTVNFYTVTPTLVNYHFGPESRSFSLLANMTNAVFTATRDGVITGNAIDTAEYFVRQHYLDFLGREPDESGFNFWSDQILSCGSDAACIERRTINVSAAYFLSIEFQETGGLVDGLYRVSYSRRPLHAEFMPDTRTVAEGVVVGSNGDWAGRLAANKEAFVDAWVQRPAFQAAYGGLSNDAYVDTLISHTGVSFAQSERDALVSSLGSGTSRANVLRQIAEDEGFVSARRNAAFVMMQYFGYLQRDPDESGYAFWLNKLNEFNGNFERAEMVKAFLVSSEYRQRFRP